MILYYLYYPILSYIILFYMILYSEKLLKNSLVQLGGADPLLPSQETGWHSRGGGIC